jgi:hypothetical protein
MRELGIAGIGVYAWRIPVLIEDGNKGLLHRG